MFQASTIFAYGLLTASMMALECFNEILDPTPYLPPVLFILGLDFSSCEVTILTDSLNIPAGINQPNIGLVLTQLLT